MAVRWQVRELLDEREASAPDCESTQELRWARSNAAYYLCGELKRCADCYANGDAGSAAEALEAHARNAEGLLRRATLDLYPSLCAVSGGGDDAEALEWEVETTADLAAYLGIAHPLLEAGMDAELVVRFLAMSAWAVAQRARVAAGRQPRPFTVGEELSAGGCAADERDAEDVASEDNPTRDADVAALGMVFANLGAALRLRTTRGGGGGGKKRTAPAEDVLRRAVALLELAKAMQAEGPRSAELGWAQLQLAEAQAAGGSPAAALETLELGAAGFKLGWRRLLPHVSRTAH